MQPNDSSPNGFQAFSTILALLLPIIQFFFNYLPSQSQGIFLIQPYFLVVSIIAAVFAYLLIIAYKYTTWFQFSLNPKKNRAFKNYEKLIDPTIYTEDEIKKNKKNHQVDQPFYINPSNIYYLLIPLVFLLVVCFLGIGFFFKGSPNEGLVFVQAILYITLVALTSLTLGAFYINDSNRRRNESVNKEKYNRVLQLLFDSRALNEFPVIEFLGQGSLQIGSLTTIIKVNGQKTYRVNTDFVAGVLQTVEHIPDNLPTSGENSEQ